MLQGMNQETSVNRLEIGHDVFNRVGDGQLIKQVLEAVDRVESFIPVSSRPDFKPVQILTLLTYCYARGIYSSEEIEVRLPEDNAIAYICAGQKPDWHLLRRFRRQHIFLLTETLAQLFKLVAPVNGVCGDDIVSGQTRYQKQARLCLQDAIQADSIAMDV